MDGGGTHANWAAAQGFEEDRLTTTAVSACLVKLGGRGELAGQKECGEED